MTWIPDQAKRTRSFQVWALKATAAMKDPGAPPPWKKMPKHLQPLLSFVVESLYRFGYGEAWDLHLAWLPEKLEARHYIDPLTSHELAVEMFVLRYLRSKNADLSTSEYGVNRLINAMSKFGETPMQRVRILHDVLAERNLPWSMKPRA